MVSSHYSIFFCSFPLISELPLYICRCDGWSPTGLRGSPHFFPFSFFSSDGIILTDLPSSLILIPTHICCWAHLVNVYVSYCAFQLQIAGLGFVISLSLLIFSVIMLPFNSINMVLFGSSNVLIVVDLNIFSSVSGSFQGQFLLTACLPE